MEPLLPSSLYGLMLTPSYLPGMLSPLLFCIKNAQNEIGALDWAPGSLWKSLEQEGVPLSLPHINQDLNYFHLFHVQDSK